MASSSLGLKAALCRVERTLHSTFKRCILFPASGCPATDERESYRCMFPVDFPAINIQSRVFQSSYPPASGMPSDR